MCRANAICRDIINMCTKYTNHLEHKHCNVIVRTFHCRALAICSSLKVVAFMSIVSETKHNYNCMGYGHKQAHNLHHSF